MQTSQLSITEKVKPNGTTNGSAANDEHGHGESGESAGEPSALDCNFVA